LIGLYALPVGDWVILPLFTLLVCDIVMLFYLLMVVVGWWIIYVVIVVVTVVCCRFAVC